MRVRVQARVRVSLRVGRRWGQRWGESHRFEGEGKFIGRSTRRVRDPGSVLQARSTHHCVASDSSLKQRWKAISPLLPRRGQKQRVASGLACMTALESPCGEVMGLLVSAPTASLFSLLAVDCPREVHLSSRASDAGLCMCPARIATDLRCSGLEGHPPVQRSALKACVRRRVAAGVSHGKWI